MRDDGILSMLAAVDIRSPTYGKFPHYAFYPPFHSTVPQFPFRILPSTFHIPQFHILPTAVLTTVFNALCTIDQELPVNVLRKLISEEKLV